LPDIQKDFNQNYLTEKLHSIGDKLGDAYGEPLLNELITRMERTVAHFNEEVDVMVNALTSRTKNQRRLLASMRGEDPNLIDVKLSDLEKKLESKDKLNTNSPNETKENEKPKKKLFSFFKKKKKK
jgi:hypothetical protein